MSVTGASDLTAHGHRLINSTVETFDQTVEIPQAWLLKQGEDALLVVPLLHFVDEVVDAAVVRMKRHLSASQMGQEAAESPRVMEVDSAVHFLAKMQRDRSQLCKLWSKTVEEP